MGVSVRAKLLYGDYYRNIVDNLDEDAIEKLNEDLDYGGIESASPHYDSERDEWFVGYEVCQDFDYLGIGVFIDDVLCAEEKFKERFGVYGTVRAVKDVT